MERKQSCRKIELLAPAGDLYRCKTAIRFGADAVYIGGQQFSLRSRASNFTLQDIREACAFAREYGSRIHVTVNIIPHEEDYDGLAEYLKELEDAGVTAIIVASPAIMDIARKSAPGLEIHCSTQMSVTNAEAAAYLSDTLGIDRVVLARECTMEDVRAITASCPVETEAFIHGGMCVNYSGRCTLSNKMTLRDANRGGCAQSCRWYYHLYHNEEELTREELFTMGSKDLCAAEYIYDFIEAGVSSLKIEGRMKSEYYVASIVSAYRNLIDEIEETGTRLGEERMQYHLRQILRGENRQTYPGFYPGRAGRESLILHQNSDLDVNHDFLGVVKQYRDGVMTLECRNVISEQEMIEVLAPGKLQKEFPVEWIRDENQEYMSSCRKPMTRIQIPVPFEVHENDIIRRSYHDRRKDQR
ncbi:MAG: U32 family peptidase [Solobacterium sp.]|nr:U32 family peptidase [Solobacterium sp.]